MTKGNRFTVFSIREGKTREGKVTSFWVRAGSAWLNRDVMQRTSLCGLVGNWPQRRRFLHSVAPETLVSSSPHND